MVFKKLVRSSLRNSAYSTSDNSKENIQNWLNQILNFLSPVHTSLFSFLSVFVDENDRRSRCSSKTVLLIPFQNNSFVGRLFITIAFQLAIGAFLTANNYRHCFGKGIGNTVLLEQCERISFSSTKTDSKQNGAV